MKPKLLHNKDIILSDESRFSFEDTVLLFSDRILHIGWEIQAIHDMQEAFNKNGEFVSPLKIFELYNPECAKQLLKTDSTHNWSLIMLYRVAIYEVIDNGVYISRMNPEVLATQMGRLTGKVMTKAFIEVDNVLKSLFFRYLTAV